MAEVTTELLDANGAYPQSNRSLDGKDVLVDHQQLLLDMHSDLKVVRQRVDDAKRVAVDTRQQLMEELNEVKEELKETRKCVSNQRNEITRIKTTFSIIAAIFAAAWSAALIWVREMIK